MAVVVETKQNAATNPMVLGEPNMFEVGYQHPHQTDILQRLRSNIETLEDLTGRMSFLLREIKTLTRKK